MSKTQSKTPRVAVVIDPPSGQASVVVPESVFADPDSITFDEWVAALRRSDFQVEVGGDVLEGGWPL